MKYLAMTIVLALAGCGIEQNVDENNNDSLGEGALLSVDYFGDTDVVGFHFEITAVECSPGAPYTPGSWSANVDLVDGIFPGMIDHIEDYLDADSKHLGSDLFMTLEPGCYDIVAYPASEIDGDDWESSEDCSSALAEDVEVVAETTTETVLLSQCVGDPLGAADTTVLLNHPPVIDIDIDEKYNYECEAVEVCVTFYDPDDDPMLVVWDEGSNYSFSEGTAEVIGVEGGHRIWEQCATITTLYTGDYEYGVTVYDTNGEGDTFESYLEDANGDSVESHATLTFPVYTNWIELPLCWDSDTSATVEMYDEILRDAVCLKSATSAQEYYCEGSHELRDFLCVGSDTDADGVDDTWTLDESALYPECL